MSESVLSLKYTDTVSHFSRHYHDCHQLLFITGGSAQIIVGAKNYMAKSGTLIIISRYENHSVQILSDDYKRFSLRISPYAPEGDREDYTLFSVLTNRPQSFVHAIDVSDYFDEVLSLFKNMKTEFDGNDKYSKNMLNLYLKQLLVLLYRKEPQLFTDMDDEATGIIHSIQSSFQSNCKEQYTLNGLSEKYNISVFYLSHLFKKVTGFSVMSYLLSCRIANAKKLLTKTNTDIGTISRECGFSDSANFSRKFKSETGLTPTDFRRSMASKTTK